VRHTVPKLGEVKRPRAKGYDADINGILLRLFINEQNPYQRVSAQAAPNRLQTEVNPEDFGGDTISKTFSRTDFSGGEGLDFAHRRDGDERDYSRYWDSVNVDITKATGQPTELKLLHSTSSILTATDLWPNAILLDGKLFWCNGNNVDRCDDPLGASPSIAQSEDPHAGQSAAAVQAMGSLGNELYAAITGSGVHKRSSGGTWTHWSDQTTTLGVWGLKGRVLGTTGNDLYQLAAAAGSTLLKTLPTGRSFVDATDAGAAILVAADDGYIYAWSDVDGTLTEQAQTFFQGEVPVAIKASQGFVFVLTTQTTTGGGTMARWWRAELDASSFVLVNAQVIRQWGDSDTTIDLTPAWMATDRDHIYTAVRDEASATTIYAWRYDFATAAVARDLTFTVSSGKQPRSLIITDERTFLTTNGDGIYREDTTFAASGWLVLPAADFFDARVKRWAGLRMLVDEITSDERVDLLYSTDLADLTSGGGTSWIQAVTSGTGDIEVPLAAVSSRYLLVKVSLTASGDATVTPKVRSVSARGYPATQDVVVDLPVNVSDQIERKGRARVRVPGRGEATYQELRKLEGDAVLLNVYRPAEQVRGTVEQVSLPVRVVSPRGSVTMVANVRVRGTRLSSSEGDQQATRSTLGRLGVDRLGETA
jgi:hypothetical protein